MRIRTIPAGSIIQGGRVHPVLRQSAQDRLENRFEEIWLQCGGPKLERQYPIVVRDYAKGKDRQFVFDFYLPRLNWLIEINGGQYAAKSGHSNIRGLERDAIKCNEAQMRGCKVFTFTSSMVKPDYIRDMAKLAFAGESVR